MWWVANDCKLERVRERWYGSGGASGCNWVMAMMGEVSDWGEREKKGLEYFSKIVLQNWRRKPIYVSKGLFYPQL